MLGKLLHHYNLRRLNVRGLAGAHKKMLLRAWAYSFKKLLAYRFQRMQQVVIALRIPPQSTADQFWRRQLETGASCSATVTATWVN
jgi:hypothetical protein